MPTLNQWFGSFLTESRAEIFSQCRQDCPLLPLINKSGFHALREEKIGQKPPTGHQPFNHQIHHRKPTQPPTDHQAATTALSLLLPSFLSPLQPFLLPPTADSGHWHLCPLHSRPVTTIPSPPSSRLPFFSSIVCNYVKVINISFGPGQFRPNPNGWAGSGPQKNENKFKNPFKKNCDFLTYFSTYFA
jgi:hypothetical protein